MNQAKKPLLCKGRFISQVEVEKWSEIRRKAQEVREKWDNMPNNHEIITVDFKNKRILDRKIVKEPQFPCKVKILAVNNKRNNHLIGQTFTAYRTTISADKFICYVFKETGAIINVNQCEIMEE